MSKFSVGNEVIVTACETSFIAPPGTEYEAVVYEVGRFIAIDGEVCEYKVVIAPSGRVACAQGWQLRKKRPPQQDNEKAEDWFIEDLNKLLQRERVTP